MSHHNSNLNAGPLEDTPPKHERAGKLSTAALVIRPQPARSDEAIHGNSHNASSSNQRANTYVIPAQRSTTALNSPSGSTDLSIPAWRRKVQTPTQQAVVRPAPALPGPFRPMDEVRGMSPNFTAEEKVRAGFSWRYKGDIHNPKNSSLGISPEQNCALFLTNLPTGTTVKILLDALGMHAPFGRVYATSVAPATEERHPTACAKIAMFTREEAVRVFDFIDARGFRVAGRTIQVTWNNNRSPPQTDVPSTASRVLEILGPLEVMDIHRLHRFLNSNLRFDTQDVSVVREDDEERLIRWTFGSFRAQAQVARKALRAEWPGLHIRWGIDPMSLPINMVPGVESTIPSSFPEDGHQTPTAAGHVGENESVGDLMTFESDVEPEENIYDA